MVFGPKVPKLVGRIQRNKHQYHNVGAESNIAATAAICDVVIRMMEYYVDYVYGLTRALTETHVWFKDLSIFCTQAVHIILQAVYFPLLNNRFLLLP